MMNRSIKRKNCKFSIPVIILLAVCIFGRSSKAQTNTYVFDPNQSTVLQTGGFAGIHRVYTVEGQFQLTVDFGSGTASFYKVDANAVDDSQDRRTLDPNEVFAMTALVGALREASLIEFTGYSADGSSILLEMTIFDNTVALIGQTTPPPNSADFFIFSMDAVANRKYAGGTGEPNNPFQIATAEDLILLGETTEDYNKHFILTSDIDLDPNLPGGKVFDKAVIAPDVNVAENWFQGPTFTGEFDGDGHTISNLTIVGGSYLGLFGQLDPGAVISDLGLDAINVHGRFGSIGGLVGSNGYSGWGIEEGGHIENCYSKGTVSGETAGSVGGLVGANGGSISNCSSIAAVSGSALPSLNPWYANIAVGGLIGYNGRSASVNSSHSTCSVTGDRSVGGLVGSNVGHIEDCSSAGSVTGIQYVGGLSGYNYATWYMAREYGVGVSLIHESSSSCIVSGETQVGGLAGFNEGEIHESYSSGAVQGDSEVGGLVGANTEYDEIWGYITSSYSTSTVRGNNGVGGLVGVDSSGYALTKCYSTGAVFGEDNVGGLVGQALKSKILMSSFWDIETSGQLTSGGGTGKTTAEMQTESTFTDAGWDFENIWWILEGQDYPRLWWELTQDDN